ncbi:hypothetical protein BaRGS_00011446 [Batillaria attramentaria]|uniref:Uncharacterized protein n=1 Tax=Batillaria attramentaria TaxID=370345 RepID=A0ABD0LCV0_9CAEN
MPGSRVFLAELTSIYRATYPTAAAFPPTPGKKRPDGAVKEGGGGPDSVTKAVLSGSTTSPLFMIRRRLVSDTNFARPAQFLSAKELWSIFATVTGVG